MKKLLAVFSLVLAIAAVELLIVHFLIGAWAPWLAATLSAISLAAIGWIAALVLSFRRRPVRIDGDIPLLQVGMLRSVAVPLDRVAGLRAAWTAEELKRREVLNLALLAWPNVMVEVDPPVRVRRRAIGAIGARPHDAPTAAHPARGARRHPPAVCSAGSRAAHEQTTPRSLTARRLPHPAPGGSPRPQ